MFFFWQRYELPAVSLGLVSLQNPRMVVLTSPSNHGTPQTHAMEASNGNHHRNYHHVPTMTVEERGQATTHLLQARPQQLQPPSPQLPPQHSYPPAHFVRQHSFASINSSSASVNGNNSVSGGGSRSSLSRPTSSGGLFYRGSRNNGGGHSNTNENGGAEGHHDSIDDDDDESYLFFMGGEVVMRSSRQTQVHHTTHVRPPSPLVPAVLATRTASPYALTSSVSPTTVTVAAGESHDNDSHYDDASNRHPFDTITTVASSAITPRAENLSNGPTEEEWRRQQAQAQTAPVFPSL